MDRKSWLCQHCGKCCESIVLPVQKPLEKSIMLEWLKARGGEIVAEQAETWYVKLNSPCPRLEKSGGKVVCKGYENRPHGCRIFDGTTLDWLDCAWKDSTQYIVKAIKWHTNIGLEKPEPKPKPAGAPPPSVVKPHPPKEPNFTGHGAFGRPAKPGHKPRMSTDQKKRLNKRRALERKQERIQI